VSTWRQNLFAVTAAGFTGFTLVMPFLPLYFAELGVTDVGDIALWSGLSLGVTPAITALMAPLWGRLADRVGRKIMIERSLVSFVIVMAAMAFVTRAWHIFALRAIQGLFAGYGALALTMAADIAPRDRMAFAIGTVQTAQRIGPALGPVIGGAVAQLVGLRQAFFVTATFYVVALVLVFFLYDERGLVRHEAVAAKPKGRVTFRNVLAFENFILLIAVVFGFTFVDRSFGPVLPLYIAELGTSLDRVPIVSGIVFSLGAGAAAIGNHLCRPLLDRASPRVVIAGAAAITTRGDARSRSGRHRWLPIAAAVAAIGTLTFVVAGGTGLLMLGTPILGLGIGAASTAAYTAAGAVIPPEVRGTGFGLLSTGALLGLALSPVICGLLGTLSLRAVFVLDTCILVLVGLLVRRLMVTSRMTPTAAPATEEV
jgi:DHA1 family multidrug resistance protein-like MFS transporter